MRVPVIGPKGDRLMPTKPSRARRWIKQGLAVGKFDKKLGRFYVQLLKSPSGYATQTIAVGLDPGKHFTGMAVQSKNCTLLMLHLYLPFKTITERMSQRRMMRRTRRGRRINRKLPFSQRAHRQKRFNNRRQSKLPPSIRANKNLEYQILERLQCLYPVTDIVVEVIKASGNKGFSPVMQGQSQFLKDCKYFECWAYGAKTHTRFGWETSNIRQALNLPKEKGNKSLAIPATHAVDGVALAASQFINYGVTGTNSMGWQGEVNITPAQFIVVRRPPISRRQLHLIVPSAGGVRRKYGGTVTRHGFRKGDLVKAPSGQVGYCSGDTEKALSLSDADWRRLGRFSPKKSLLIRRNTGLIVLSTRKLSSFIGNAQSARYANEPIN